MRGQGDEVPTDLQHPGEISQTLIRVLGKI